MSFRRPFTIPLPGDQSLQLGDRTLVMGIINVTPDSFSDGGLSFDRERAIEAGLRLVEEGADILDIGGESTRPGAVPISEAEERRRVMPVVEALAARTHVPLSIDTYKAGVADDALGCGASIVNDISGLRFEPALAEVTARRRAALILMHTRGRPTEMAANASYLDVVDEVRDELRESMAFAAGAGIEREKILIDPGIGFAKNAAQSYEVLGRVAEFADLGRPIVIGASRKSFLVKATGVTPADSRDYATAGAVTAAILGGAHVVRVHAVAAMRQVVRVADEIRRYHRAD